MVGLAARLAAAAAGRPRLALAVVLAATLAAAAGLPRLELSTDGRALVPRDDPAVVADAAVRARFGLADPLAVVVESAHPEGLYNADTLRRLRELSAALQELFPPESHAVTSLATEARDRVDSFDNRPFLEPPPETPEELAALAADVRAARLPLGTLVSADERAAAILLAIPPGEPGETRWTWLERVRAVVGRVDLGGDRVRIVGAPAAEVLLGVDLARDLATLLPLALLVLGLVVWLGCRRGWGVALGLAEGAGAVVFTFGVMGWAGTPVYLPAAVLPVVLVTVGLTDEIHLFWHHQRRLAASPVGASGELVRATMAEMARPVTWTSLTTAAAFLAFLASDLVPLQRFGAYAALGVGYCWLWSMAVVPAALALLPADRLRRPAARRRGTARLAGALPVSGPLRLAVLGVVTVGMALGIPRLVVQDGWIDGFAAKSPFRQDVEAVHQAFFGTHLLLLELDFQPVEGRPVPEVRERRGPLLDPEIVGAVAELEAYAASLPGVGGVLGLASHLSAVHHLSYGRRPEAWRVPSTPFDLHRMLHRLDLFRGSHRRRQVVDDELTGTVVTVFLKDARYRETAGLMRSLEGWAEEHLAPLGGRLTFAGDVAVSQAMITSLVRGQLRSLALALAGGWLLVSLLFRSPAAGLLAMLPVSAAAVWVLGGMGWAGVPLGVATSTFLVVTLGVGVDFAIHLLARPPGSPPAAVAPAIVADTVALAAGFGVLVFSRVPANARLGLLVAAGATASCLITLWGLPALERHRPRPPASTPPARSAPRRGSSPPDPAPPSG